jgi:hypothetical protein
MTERVAKIYLDTSVFGGYYDPDFEEDTLILFEKIKLGQFKVVYSNTTEDELGCTRKSTRITIKSFR